MRWNELLRATSALIAETRQPFAAISGLAAGALQAAAQFVRLGFAHILGGIDHLLFLLCLLALVSGPRQLLWTVTAFTAAHSLSLALAALGLLRLPSPPVEAAIALSIALLAAELCRPASPLLRRRPYAAAFAFGLVHGLGFAGGLGEIGLPERDVGWALAVYALLALLTENHPRPDAPFVYFQF